MSFWGRIFGVQKNPEYELGIRYFNAGRYDLAVEQLEKAVSDLGPGDPTYALGMFYAAESHVHLGTARFHAGDLDAAFEHFSVAVRENPTYPDLYYRMGVILHRRGENDAAISMLSKALSLNERYFEAVCYLGIVLYGKGEREEADRAFARALELGSLTPSPISKFLSDHIAGCETDIPPLAELCRMIYTDTDFDSLMREGIEAFNIGRSGRAVECFDAAVSIHPEYADVRFKLGLALLREGRSEEARAQFLEALRINEHYTEARFYLGVAYLDGKMYREALPHFERAAAEKPGYADLQCYLGATLFCLGDLSGAQAALDRALGISPGYPKARYYYGLLLYARGEKHKAVECLSSGITQLDRPAAAVSLGLMHLREGNLEEAMAVLREVVEAGGESADVLYFLGEVYLRLSRTFEAEDLFRRALAANPSFLRAREKLALILVQRGDYEAAEAELGGTGSDFADICKIMGDIKFYRGDLGAAESLYRRSLELNAAYGDASISLALTLRGQGRDGEARELLEALIDREPENVVARNLVGRGPLDLETG